MSTTYLLDKFLKEKRSQREKVRREMIKKVNVALKKLASQIPFDEAYLFGTITRPYRFLENSDIDIAFLGLKDENYFTASAFLSRELSRDVDIIQLEKHRLKEKIVKQGIKWKR